MLHMFIGNRCENCINLQCQNGGICNHTNGVAQCHCPSGYSGIHCEKSDCDGYCINVSLLYLIS